MTSLRNRLLAGLVGAIVVVGTLGAWLSYRIARAEADAFFDAQLRETALLLRDEVQVFPGTARLPRSVDMKWPSPPMKMTASPLSSFCAGSVSSASCAQHQPSIMMWKEMA